MQQPKCILLLTSGVQFPVLNDPIEVEAQRAQPEGVYDVYANQQKSPLTAPELVKSTVKLHSHQIIGVIEIGDEVVDLTDDTSKVLQP